MKGAWSIAPIYLQAPLCRTILDELFLTHKPTAFKMPRTKTTETSKSIADYFESAEDTFCVITKDALEGIIQQNADVQQKNLDIQQKYLEMQQKSMDIHQSIKESNESISRSLDLLARTVSSTHSQHQTQSSTLHKKQAMT